MHVMPVGDRPFPVHPTTGPGRKQLLFQLYLGQFIGERPGQTGTGEAGHIVGHHGTGDTTAAGNLPVRQPLLGESKDFFELAYR